MKNKNTTAVKTAHRSKFDAKVIALTAMFAALITVVTAFIKIPTALGYSHAGDSMIYLASCILPGSFGIIASAIGGFFADLLAGYANWALPTALIKAFNALPFFICRYFLKKYGKDDRIINIPNLIMIIPTTIVTVGGYFIANGLMYDFTAAIAELATWYLQPGIGAIIFVAVGLGLDSIKFKERTLQRYL